MDFVIDKPSDKDIAEIFLDEDIYSHSADDDSPSREEFDPSLFKKAGWDILGAFQDNKIVSLFMVDKGEMHFMVLKPFRKYAIELLDLFVRLYNKSVFVKVPACYQNIIKFAARTDFIKVGVEKESFKKYGKLHDCYIYRRELCQQ